MSMRTKLFGVFAAGAMLAGALAVPASADNHSQNSSPSVTVNPDPAGVHFDLDQPGLGGIYPTVNNFAAVTLTGTPQLTAAQIPPFTVIDDSGALAGWNVTLTMGATFQDGTGADCATGASLHTIDATATSMNAPSVIAGTSDTTTTGVTPQAFSDFTTARKIVTTAAGDGAGTFLISPAVLKLTVPSTTKAGTYCDLATIAVASAP